MLEKKHLVFLAGATAPFAPPLCTALLLSYVKGGLSQYSESSCFDIERFHSRGQHLYRFIGTKESVCIRKEFISHRIVLVHQHGRRFIVLEHQYGRRDLM